MATISTPFTLEHSATLKTVISLWHHKVKHDKPTDFSHLHKPLPLDQVPLPEVLRKRLATNSNSIADNITDWVCFHREYIFAEKAMSYPLLFLDHLVWYDDGIIDYFATAENLLRNSALSDLEKFDIAKAYFFIEFIAERYPHVPKDEMKTWFIPLEKFHILMDTAVPELGNNRLRLHKRIAEFLNWYFYDTGPIVSFTFPMMVEVKFEGGSDKTLVKKLLLELGHRVPLPV